MNKYSPITEDNVYGVIPLIGFASSCITSGLIMGSLQEGSSPFWIDYVYGWLALGLLVFATVQALWGFHAKHRECLRLWIICKCVETTGPLIAIPTMRYFFSGSVLGCGIVNLALIIVLVYVGYKKYKPMKEASLNNRLLIERNLDNKMEI